MKQYGTISPARTLSMRNEVGTAKHEDGSVYELASGFGSYSPIVRCRKTGKWFSLPWTDIIDMARAAGISEPETEDTPQAPTA